MPRLRLVARSVPSETTNRRKRQGAGLADGGVRGLAASLGAGMFGGAAMFGLGAFAALKASPVYRAALAVALTSGSRSWSAC